MLSAKVGTGRARKMAGLSAGASNTASNRIGPLGLEYDFLSLANWTSATVPAVSLNRDIQMVKAGINYKFESGISDAAASTSRGYTRDPSEDEDLAKKSQNRSRIS